MFDESKVVRLFQFCNVANKIFLFYFCGMITNKPPKQYTIAKFAEKHGLSRTTVWRWVTEKDQEKRLKMYDARKIVVAGKIFIEA